RERRHILRTIRNHPFETWERICGYLGITRYRLLKVAREERIYRRVAARSPVLTRTIKRRRLSWARENRGRDWSQILFSDESSLEV
ncbi:hypothetical protein IE53DRAFT_303750, partial [Violaceomyces palustris]